MHVGHNIKRLVEATKGTTHKAFAEKIGHTEQSLHGIYKKEDVSTSVLKTVCEKLNITLSEFFKEDNLSSPKKAKVVFELNPDDVLSIDIKNRKLEITKK